MEKNLLDLLESLIKDNQEQFDFASSVGLTNQMEFYAGKLSAYRLIESYAQRRV
jgi:hypothetical protein